MPSADDVFDDLEGDRRSREGEIRLVERLIGGARTEAEREMLQRSLVLLTYAHLEGYCKFALLSYAAAVNAQNIKCSQASYPLAAAGLSKLFSALRNPSSKHKFFNRAFPEDTQLHLIWREQVFVEAIDGVGDEVLDLSDDLVDTQSNLSANVLRKMLFKLGFAYPIIDQHEGNLGLLLGIRNAIAHGDRLRVPKPEQLRDCVAAAIAIMEFLQLEVYGALYDRAFLRRPDSAAGAVLVEQNVVDG